MSPCNRCATILKVGNDPQATQNRCVHIAGTQEDRAYNTSIRMEEGFVACRSAADGAGGHGCGMYLDTSIPWCKRDGVETFITSDDVNIGLAEPRTLCVGLSSAECELLSLSAHGPRPGSKDCEIGKYWQTLEEWVCVHKRGIDVIMCTDANATLVNSTNGHVGEVVSKRANEATESFENVGWI